MARLQVGEVRPCQACGVTIIGALTVHGKVAPMEVQPHPDGNVLLARSVPMVKTDDGWVLASEYQQALGDPDPDLLAPIRAAVAAGEHLAWARAQHLAMHRNHFASCPHRDRFAPHQR